MVVRLKISIGILAGLLAALIALHLREVGRLRRKMYELRAELAQFTGMKEVREFLEKQTDWGNFVIRLYPEEPQSFEPDPRKENHARDN